VEVRDPWNMETEEYLLICQTGDQWGDEFGEEPVFILGM